MRSMLFVSHANPEDNVFAQWLALRLARAGYGVWCDLTRLLGGERFWDSIEIAVRESTAKFLFVLSRTSNVKTGPRDELELALRVQRELTLSEFVIPLWIDDLPAAQHNVRLQNVTAVRFQEGWAPGLAQLLEKLTTDEVPKAAQFGPQAVAEWWRAHGAAISLRLVPEQLVTNWYPLRLPVLYLHQLGRQVMGPIEAPTDLPWPAAQHELQLLSFASAEALAPHLGPVEIRETSEARWDDEPVTGPLIGLSRKVRRSLLTQLLKQSWHNFLEQRGLPIYAFANRNLAFYFPKGLVPDDRLQFRLAGGGSSWRNVVGYRTIGRGDGSRLRHWHFALHARPVVTPGPFMAMKPHVLFSDDGASIWASSDRLHRARRSQCRQWWNAKWRDLIAASVQWLAGETAAIAMHVAPGTLMEVAVEPVGFQCPVSYDEADLEPHDDIDEPDEEADASETELGADQEENEPDVGDDEE